MVKLMHKIFIIFFLCNTHLAYGNLACNTAGNTEKVVVAGGSLTEIMYFLGLQKKIVAADVTSSYPEEAKKLPSIGYVRALSTEGVLSLGPTLIIGEDDMGPKNVVEQIKRTNVDMRIIPETHSVDGIKRKVVCLGNIFGLPKKTQKKIGDQLDPLIKELDDIQDKNNLTHDLNLALRFADKIALISNGKIEKISGPETFFNEYLFSIVYGLKMSFNKKLMKIFYF